MWDESKNEGGIWDDRNFNGQCEIKIFSGSGIGSSLTNGMQDSVKIHDGMQDENGNYKLQTLHEELRL